MCFNFQLYYIVLVLKVHWFLCAGMTVKENHHSLPLLIFLSVLWIHWRNLLLSLPIQCYPFLQLTTLSTKFLAMSLMMELLCWRLKLFPRHQNLPENGSLSPKNIALSHELLNGILLRRLTTLKIKYNLLLWKIAGQWRWETDSPPCFRCLYFIS